MAANEKVDLRELAEKIDTWGEIAQDALRDIQEAAVPFARDPKAVRAGLRAYFLAMRHAKAASSLAGKIKTAYEKMLLMHGLRPIDDGAEPPLFNEDGEPTAAAVTDSMGTMPVPQWAERGTASLLHRWGGCETINDLDIPASVWFEVQQFLDKQADNGSTNEWTARAVALLRLEKDKVKDLAKKIEALDLPEEERPDLEYLLVPNYVDEEVPAPAPTTAP